ncbi:ice-binding family protein [Aurantibacillus circumpalustris]|uniref:ice-binding family protein n=1 Tax=Aurantibacillus circumpalustris TaxID=3036359 RepID=UPI00295AAA2A|nr:ice-binding family protein [Aurantibacillus circumpalustris]
MKNKLLIALIVALLFLIPAINYGQAPNLGTSANFALFTSIGAVTNVGTSHVTGNVGSNVGPSTGFGNVNGNMLNNNGATALCAADLLTAYNQLNTTVPGFFPASPLGNGAVLTAGVYSLSGNSILSNTLILNAQGNPSAVFIFLISGTFSSNSNAVITLSNSAQACNVFWKVEGAVGLSSGTSFKGTIIANNAAISMSSSVTLEGRALSTTGAVSVNNVLVYTPLGCNAAILNGPAAPALASAACYAIFSANGAVTNVGVTTVTGDIGSNNGLTTGYNPLFVLGAIHPIPDLSTAQCSVDLGNVYTYLNTLPNDILLLYPAQFGNNLVLTPHTYLMNGAVTLTDSLYLNAQGNANAVFVIQVNGAFSTSVNSKIILINGTQAKNVFWKIDGALSINGNSISKGTFIVNNAAIILATGVNLNGRILTTTGALSTFASTVNIPPSVGISGASTDQTVCAGSSVVFSVSSTGGTSYQWRKGTTNLLNGGNISGATSATLTLNPVNVLDAASDYNLVIGGGCAGDYTTTNISLVVNPSATITTSIPNQTVCIGSPVTFSVSVASALTYQWRKGTTNLINGGAISGATTATLTINPVAALDAANNYNLIITGACGSNYTSTNISLAVNNSPSINNPINDQIICNGSGASFSVAPNATGYTYQWRNGTVNLVNGANISGANSATLVINPASISDTSSYYNVIISGLCTTNFTSANVSLSIAASPTIAAAISNQTVCAGNSADFIANVSGTGLTYQWRNGSINLINGGNISGANTATLIINPVTVADSSSFYNVIISGPCLPNYTSTNISLVLTSSPVILVSAIDQTVCVGSPAGFSVSASGSGYTYQWRNGTVNLNNSTSVSGATSATLNINPTIISDASANYNLIVSGSCATNYTSANVSLVLNSAQNPIVSSNFSVCVGKPIALTTQSVSGATYTWTGPSSYSTNVQNPTIISALISNAGTYTLEITANNCKSAASTITVSVHDCIDIDFYIPEGYSPNDDGINDVFVIRGITYFPDNAFVIFNRWGEKVFEASPYQNNWNGKATMGLRIGGDNLPVGTYFYILDLKNGTPVYKGTIYLNR